MLNKNDLQKFRFAAVGGLNTCIDFGLLFFLSYLGLNVIIANYVSTTIALTFSFFANKKYTFRVKGATRKREILLFFVFTGIGIWVLQPMVIAVVRHFAHSGSTAHGLVLLFAKLVATAVSLVWNYISYSRFVFKAEHQEG